MNFIKDCQESFLFRSRSNVYCRTGLLDEHIPTAIEHFVVVTTTVVNVEIPMVIDLHVLTDVHAVVDIVGDMLTSKEKWWSMRLAVRSDNHT